MSAQNRVSSDHVDPRGCWMGLTTPDGLEVQGSIQDGYHVRREGIVLASFYRGLAGESPLAALAAFRESEQRRAMATTD